MKRIALFLALIAPLSSWGKSTRTLKVDTLESSYAAAMDVVNGDFERGTTGWSVSSTTPTTPGASTVTTFASVARGSQSIRWDSDGAGRYLEGTPLQLRAGLYGKNGVVSCQFKCASGTCTHTLGAYDGSGNTLASSTITSTATFSRTSVNFVYPSSGSVKPRITAVAADEPELIVDDCTVGDASEINLSQVSQASFYGALEWAPAASCTWSVTANSSYSDFSADTDCNNPTATGNATAPGTKVPQIVLNNMPPGDYLFIQSGYNYGNSSTTGCVYQFSDGTTAFGFGGNGIATANIVGAHVMGRISYTSTANRTIKLQATAVGGSQACYVSAATTGAEKMMISVYRFPSTSEQAVRVDQTPASWSGYHSNDCAWSTTSTSFVTPSADASCTFTEIYNRNFGTVSSSGSKTPGITFTPPRTGRYQVCAGSVVANGTSGNGNRVQLIDTNSSTTLDSRIMHGTANYALGFTLCGVLNVSSITSYTVGVQIADPSSTTVSLNSGDSAGRLSWSIFELDAPMPAPLLVGSVTSNSSGLERSERAYIRDSGTAAVSTQSGSWISSVSDNSTGNYTVNIASGIFSAAPTCTCSVDSSSARFCTVAPSSATSIDVRVFTDGGAASDEHFFFLCQGPR